MIFGHEGMPRSGKSAEAMPLIADALSAGRTVVTNVAGISHKFFSDYCVLPLATVQRLLVVIEPPSDMPEDDVVPWVKAQFFDRRIQDSFWVWDEINQFWPPDRLPLPPDWAKFVTEHGHKGIDILIMGQDLAELHKTWRGRLQRYTRFTKLDMQGKDDSFHWSSLTNIGRSRYKQTASGKKNYNKAFFGAYKSHEDGTNNKQNYKDGRFSVFQKKHKVWFAVFLVVLVVSLFKVFSFFRVDKPASASASASKPAPAPAPKPEPKPEPKLEPKPEPKPEPIDYLDKLMMTRMPRLSGVLERSTPVPGLPTFDFVVEFLDESNHVRERMGRSEVVAMGWSVDRTDYGLDLSKGAVRRIVRPWPLDLGGRVPDANIKAMKPEQGFSAVVPVPVTSIVAAPASAPEPARYVQTSDHLDFVPR